MVVVKFLIENDGLSKEKLLKYYDLVTGIVFNFVNWDLNCILKSKNLACPYPNLWIILITASEFKVLANDFRKEIQEDLVEDDRGELLHIQSYLKLDSIFSLNTNTIQNDLEHEYSLEFSDSILVDSDFIIVTLLDPFSLVIDYENCGLLEVTSDIDSDLYREGLDNSIIQIQVKDEYDNFCKDVYSITGLKRFKG